MGKLIETDPSKMDLPTLAAGINEAHEQAVGAARTAIEHARQCGEMLLAAKAKVKHGEWLPWLEKNCRVKERQARNYMRVAENWGLIEKSAPDADLTIAEAARINDSATFDDPRLVECETKIKNLLASGLSLNEKMPELDESHTLNCMGEDDLFGLIIPLGKSYYYVGVIDRKTGEAVEHHRGVLDKHVPDVLRVVGLKPAGWYRRPLCADDMNYIMEVKAYWASPEGQEKMRRHQDTR